jgi:hypothetical protein
MRTFCLVYCMCVAVYHVVHVGCDAMPKKDVRDYTDADIERLYEEWEVWQQSGVSTQAKRVHFTRILVNLGK